MNGIDVSNNNGPVDMRAVRAAGKRFVYAKATQGAGRDAFIDPTYPTNRAKAEAEPGLLFGAYCFAVTGSSPEAQADTLLAAAKPRVGELAPALDMEGDVPPDPTFALTILDRWAKALNGSRCTLYASESYIGQMAAANPAVFHTLAARHNLWVAKWGDTPPTRYALWQYRGGAAPGVPAGSCPGVVGACDLDALNPSVDVAELVVRAPRARLRPWTITITAGPDDGTVIGKGKTITGANVRRRVWQAAHPRRWRRVTRLRYDRPAP